MCLHLQRINAKHNKMKAALAEKLAMEQEEGRKREEQVWRLPACLPAAACSLGAAPASS